MTREDDRVTALDLPPLDPLPEDTAKYFAICQEKLGLVPNVLTAYAFDKDTPTALGTRVDEAVEIVQSDFL